MALDPKAVEGRNFGVIPLTGGLNLTDARALVQPGTLQDCLNYEVVDRGYTRGQGLMLYNGSYGSSVEDMWYIADTTANGVSYSLSVPGSQPLGITATWEGGSGKLVYWHVNYDADPAEEFAAIGITDVDGIPPTAAGLTITTTNDSWTPATFTSPRAAQKLADATYPNSGELVASSQSEYLDFINAANTAITSQTASSWTRGYKPNPPGTGAITGGFQFNDRVYVARDYFGIGFYDGVLEPSIDARLNVNGDVCRIAKISLEEGSWANGTAAGVFYLQPDSTTVLTEADIAAIPEAYQIDLYPATTQVAKYTSSRNKNKGQLWKSSEGGWLHVDLGWSTFFENGTNEPNSIFGPLFVTDLADDPDVTNKIQASAYTPVTSASENGDTPLVTWTNLSEIYAEDGTCAYAALPANGGKSYEIDTNFLSLPVTASKITGVEVQVKCRQTTGTSEVQLTKLRLINTTTGAVFESDDKAYDTPLTTSLATYTFGGQFDEWGLDDIDIADLGNYGVRLQFINTDGSTARTVEVDVVKVKVHYLSTGQFVYFYNGTTDTGVGFIHSYETYSGLWTDPWDATGHMNITSPTMYFINDTQPGDEIWTGAGGTGTYIATITTTVKRNLLPSEAELAAEDSKWRTIEANFYANDEGNAIYGCTGASPAFLFDTNEVFGYIYPPIDKNKNKPRHVAFNANHLVLGMPSGHILISAIDQPNNFDPADFSSIFSFRDPVTGLNPLTGNALGVMCKSSVNALLGTQSPAVTGANDPFRPQNITPLSGAIEYTVADVMGPMYADYNGVTTADASDKFGDFGAGRLTGKIESWTRDRVQNRPSTELRDRGPVFGIQVRSKNQYRVYFEDGYILTLYLGDPEQKAQCTIAHLDTTNYSTDYVPTWMDSTVLSTGRERILMGDKNGNVWVVDGANGIQTASGLVEVDCWITTNPINTGAPQGAHKTFNVQIIGDFYGSQDITTSIGYDYLDVSSTPRTKTIGDVDAPPFFEKRADYTDVYVDSLTDGTSFKIQTAMDGSKPHTLHTLLHRYSRKGTGRNNTQVPR